MPDWKIAPANGASEVKKILVVDDDDDIRGLLRATIERATHQVLEASDGEEALSLIGRATPDLILLDVNMPGVDGPSVCRQLKTGAATGAIKILMLTAATQAADRQRGLEAGADGYITKPFSPRSLLDQLDAQLAAASA
jgi:DNA-binding response OmpR family regulator